MGQTKQSTGKAHKVTSPLRQNVERKCKSEATPIVHGLTKGFQQRKKPSLKQIARQVAQHQTQAQDTEMLNLNIGVGSKRPGMFE